MESNKEQIINILRVINTDPKHSLAIKITSLTFTKIIKELNTAQKRLYDLFVEIAGYDENAFITKAQVKASNSSID